MGIVFVFQYRGDKGRLFGVYRDDASKYLAGFFGDDLRRFNLPDPHECHLRAWHASRVLCKWETWGDSVRWAARLWPSSGWTHVFFQELYAHLLQTIEYIKGIKDTLHELEL